MKNIFRKERGITLIALVITIIIMLILVAITISMTINGGLFDYAGNATKETKKEIEQEKKYTYLESNLTTEDLIDSFTTGPDIHSWTRTGDTFTCSHCNVSYTMGEIVNYTPNTSKTQTTIYGADSGKTGDPIDQIISRETLIWVVLGLDKNGTLCITTSTPTTGKLYLKGAKAYTNGPTIMNKICKELYSNSIYGNARSINVDDVNSVLKWTDTRGMVLSVSTAETYKVEVGTKLGDVGPNKMTQEDWDAIKNNNQTPEEGKAFTDYEINGYYYDVASEVTNITTLEQNTILGSTGRYDYWLASRGTDANSWSGYACFGPGYVCNGTVSSYDVLFFSYGYDYYVSQSLRPVVPLKNELPTKASS